MVLDRILKNLTLLQQENNTSNALLWDKLCTFHLFLQTAIQNFTIEAYGGVGLSGQAERARCAVQKTRITF